MPVVVMNAWQILYKGGPMMWPILFLSILALAVGINRFMVLGKAERGLAAQKETLLASLRQGRLKETLRLCEEMPGMLAEVLKAGILRFGSSRELIRGSMEEVLDYESAKLKEHMGI